MQFSHVLLFSIMSLSCIVQFAAAAVAISLIRPSGAMAAWLFLASGFMLQGIRRCLTLLEYSHGHLHADLAVQGAGLVISLLMLLGILKFRPLFQEIHRAHRAFQEEQHKLTKANRELEEFVSTVSHDLRSPLAVMIGYAEFLQENYGDKLDEQALGCLDEIATQGGRMVTLLEDLLTVARAGYVERPQHPVSLNRVVESVLLELSGPMAEQGVTVKTDSLPTLSVPESLLAEILKNLLGNALHYACDVNKTIEIGGMQGKEKVSFFVRDHGPGIAEEERRKVFELFYRGASGTTVKGTGIGLAIVKKIAELYGGRVWVEATPRGGCTFWVEVMDRQQD
ncbi:MAG: ATP-binding protein [Desulfuromonadaceae bacterium]